VSYDIPFRNWHDQSSQSSTEHHHTQCPNPFYLFRLSASIVIRKMHNACLWIELRSFTHISL
jgi:hypothetical protein